MFCSTFWQGFFTVYLKEEYSVPEANMGYYLFVATGPNLVACIVFPIIFKNTPRKLQFITCLFMSSIACLLVGPSSFLGLP